MAMTMGGHSARPSANINVTPLIDVPFADVARVIDIAHASNIDKVGLIPHS